MAKIGIVTWETPGLTKGNLLLPLLSGCLSNHRVVFFNSEEPINATKVNECDKVIISIDIFNGTVTGNVNALLLDLDSSIPTYARNIGEWQKWFMYPTERLSTYYGQFNHDKIDYVLCDESSGCYLKYLFPNKKIIETPHFMALDVIKQYRKPMSQRNKCIFLANCGGRIYYPSLGLASYLPEDWSLGIYDLPAGALVDYQYLETEDRQKIELITDIVGHDLTNIKHLEETTTWRDYLEVLSKCSIMLCPDDRFTTGRFCIEAAALGIPCVTATGQAGKRLFPKLVVEPYNVDAQLSKIKQLIYDDTFYASCQNYALDNAGFYSVKNQQNRWRSLLEL